MASTLTALLWLLTVSPALAAAPNSLNAAGPVNVYATYHAAGVILPFDGDANENATARVEFRRAADSQWKRALDLARIRGRRFAGSIFWLSPETRYEARVILEDPDGVDSQPAPLPFETASEKLPTGIGRRWYVKAGSNGDGSSNRPLGRIQQAVDRAQASDVVVIRPGVYRESVNVAGKRGRPDAYILIRGEPGAIISGAVAELEERRGQWRAEGEKIFSTDSDGQGGREVGYVAADDQRLYAYRTLEELRARAAGVPGGWYWDPRTRRLFVTLPDGGDPGALPMRVSNLPWGFRLVNSQYVVLEGLDIGYFGQRMARLQSHGVLIEGSSHVVVRRNHIHHTTRGVSTMGSGASRVLIEENKFNDSSIFEWPWDKVKATEAEGGALWLAGGRGQVIRRNQITGYFNGVAASTWGNLSDETLNVDLDVYENELWQIGDDPIEPEGACINLRIWGNRIRQSLTVVSLAPIIVGPTYVVRNTGFNYWGIAVKMPSIDNHGVKYVLHNTFVTTLAERRLLDGSMASGGVTGMTLWPAAPGGRRPPIPPDRLALMGWSNGIFLNNLIHGSLYAYEDNGLKGKAVFDYNSLHNAGKTPLARLAGADYADLPALQKAGYERHGVLGSSRFVNRNSGDLRLASASVEIDKGIRLHNINDDFDGSAPDIGAFEFHPDHGPADRCVG
jgi:hypothetical protein